VHLLGGTNDTGTPAETLTNLQAIIMKCRAIGAAVIIGTIPPKESASAPERTRINALNAGIRRLAAVNGITLADYHAALVDPADGSIATAYFRTADSVHPNDAGFAEMARVGAAAAALVLPPWPAPLAQENTDPNNLISNGLAIDQISPSSIPTGFTGGSAMTGLTRSFVTGDPDIKGSWHKADFDGTTTGGYQLYQNIATAPVPGHRYMFAGRVKATWTSGANAFSFRNRISGGAGFIIDYSPMLNMSVSITDGVFYSEYTCPPAATTQQISVIVPAAVTGSIQWAQWTLYDLTAMGLA
jgi:hypothetical protein